LNLRPKRGNDAAINKTDVGQGFNHLQWAADEIKDTRVLGLIFVSYSQTCTNEASPSDAMWIAALDRFRAFYDEAVQMLYALQRMKPLERYAEIEAVCTRAEWQPENIFARLRGLRLNEVKK
jgi:hypothetical protein